MVRRDALERGLDEELQFHIDQQTEKNVRDGMTPGEARRRAVLRFGGVVRAQEETRDQIRPALLDDSIRDIRFGARVLWRAPGFTLAALATLAIGIGATAAIFSVVRTVMLEPLPYRDPDRVVGIWETTQDGVTQNVIAPANFIAWRERSHALEHLGMVGPDDPDGDRQRRAREAEGSRFLVRPLCGTRCPADARPRLHASTRTSAARAASSFSATSTGKPAWADGRTSSARSSRPMAAPASSSASCLLASPWQATKPISSSRSRKRRSSSAPTADEPRRMAWRG